MLDDIAAAPLHTKRPPAKAPRLEDVTTVPDETMTIAVRPAWEVMLLCDIMNVLQHAVVVRILLEEYLLRRPPMREDDGKWFIGLLQLMAVSIPRPQWDLLLNALERHLWNIDRPPLDHDTLGHVWNAAQLGMGLTMRVYGKLVYNDF